MRYTLLFIALLLLPGCVNNWAKTNCGWANQVLPIKASRKDTKGTKRRVLTANRAHKENCR